MNQIKLKAPELAAMLGMTEAAVRQAKYRMDHGQTSNIPPYRQRGTDVYWLREDVERWLREPQPKRQRGRPRKAA